MAEEVVAKLAVDEIAEKVHGQDDRVTADCLDELGIERPHRGKINVGLGRPYPPDLAVSPREAS